MMSQKIRSIAFIAAAIGMSVSSYLAYSKLAHKDVFCIQGPADCNIVNSSGYSMWQGIPIAILGMIGYAVILGLLVLLGRQKTESSVIILAFFGVAAFGAFYSLYLTYLEIFVIHAICSWCILSALCMIILFVISMITLGRSKLVKNTY